MSPSDRFAARWLGTSDALRLHRAVEALDAAEAPGDADADQPIFSSSGLTSVANRVIDSSS